MSDRRRWFASENFTADTVQYALKKTIFQPAVTLPLLLLARFIARYHRIEGWLRIFAYIGIARVLNDYLNRKALNNDVKPEWNWKKELVVCTGGSDGIGKEIVLLLVARDIKVVVLDIRPLTYKIPNKKLHYLQCDLTKPSAIASAAETIRSTYGPPTILINNAGLANSKTILTTPDDALNRIFSLNILAHFRLTREFLPRMISLNHGMIVTMASMAAYVTLPHMVDYGCTKAAAVAFHEGLAIELKTRYSAPEVRTLCVCSSWAQTPISEGVVNKSTFLSPTLSAKTVAEVVVEEILAGRSGIVHLPRVHEWLGSCARSFPWWLQDLLRLGGKGSVRDGMGRPPHGEKGT